MKKQLTLAAALALTVLVAVPMATASAQSSTTATPKMTFGAAGLGPLSISASPVVDGSATFTVTFPVQDVTGPVVFIVGKDVVGNAAVENGVAKASIKTTNFAVTDVQALFCGDSRYYPATTLPSVGTARFGLDGQPPITVSAVPTKDYEKMFETYTASIPDKSASGLVVFVLDNVVVGSGQVVNGTVSLTRGIGTMNVVYAGDSNHAPSSL